MSRRLLAGTLVLGAAILVAVFQIEGRKPVFAYGLEKFLAHPIRDKQVRLEGDLVPGSLCRIESPCGFEFRMVDRWFRSDAGTSARPELAVRYSRCIVPDTFRDIPGWEMSLVVEGTLCTGCHVFEASQLIAKCPSKYEMRRDGGASLREARPIPPCPSSLGE